MERTRTTGIYDDAGSKIVDKWFGGERINRRLGRVSQQEAEAWLARRIHEVRQAKLFGEGPRRTFREAALRHLAEEEERLLEKLGTTDEGKPHPKAQKQLDDLARHIRMLDPFIGALQLDALSDEALAPFVQRRRAEGVAAKTIRLSLEKVRRILNKAARVWREHNQPWLRVQPPLLSMPRGKRRAPFPLSYAEERALFSRLPQPLADMCLLKVNTGLRADEVCGLRWTWEVALEDGGSVFAIPPAAHKGGDYERYRLVVLNSVAQRVVEAQRGKHQTFVFVSKRRKKPLTRINNGPFHRAREAAGLRECRVHDLKHTFGARLRAAGVVLELRQVLLGHRSENITTHYSMPRLLELREAAERVVEVKDSPAVVRLIGGSVTAGPTKVPQKKQRAATVRP